MILLLGDIHGNAGILREAINKAEMVGDVTAIIQVGDFGLYPENERYFQSVIEKSTIPVYFIEGNHDDYDRWLQYTTVSRVWDNLNLFYIPRGTVMQMDNQTLAFMGGASSINKKWILRDGGHWTPLEDIRHEDIQNLIVQETHKRTILRAITYRIAATLDTATISGLQNAIAINLLLLVVYYINERIWLKFDWGTK